MQKFKVLCIAVAIALLCIAVPVFAAKRKNQTHSVPVTNIAIAEETVPVQEPDLLHIFKESYPDITFESDWDEAALDWHIHLAIPNAAGNVRECDVFWANGSMLPQEAHAEREKYWTLLYHYAAQIPNPATFSEEDIERMRNFGSTSNRLSGAGTPMFFFDMLYDGFSRAELERNIVSMQFLGHNTRIPQRIKAALERVQAHIRARAQTDPQVQEFITNIKSTDAYYWRHISGTNRKSFHSYGIAIDILPTSLNGKAIYWAWTKEKEPQKGGRNAALLLFVAAESNILGIKNSVFANKDVTKYHDWDEIKKVINLEKKLSH